MSTCAGEQEIHMWLRVNQKNECAKMKRERLGDLLSVMCDDSFAGAY